MLLGWLVDNPDKPKPIRKDVPLNQIPVKTDLSKAVLAQALVDVLKKPDAPPFTLTPMQICVGLTGDALDCVLQLAKENKIKIFDEIDPKVSPLLPSPSHPLPLSLPLFPSPLHI